MSEKWAATARYVDSSAPDGLGFVQDFLNTAAAGRPLEADLLGDQVTAQQWLDSCLAVLAEQDPGMRGQDIPLSERDTRDLRVLRDDLREGMRTGASAAGRPGDHPGGAAVETLARAGATVSLSIDGVARLEPQGRGSELIRSYLMVQLVLAGVHETGRRLKVCANENCHAAFFDQSKNGSRIWHDVKSCGNVANVRAYRERSRSTS